MQHTIRRMGVIMDYTMASLYSDWLYSLWYGINEYFKHKLILDEVDLIFSKNSYSEILRAEVVSVGWFII